MGGEGSAPGRRVADWCSDERGGPASGLVEGEPEDQPGTFSLDRPACCQCSSKGQA